MTKLATIRPLFDEDVPALAVLAHEIWRAHYPGIISAAQIEYMLAERYDEAVIREELKRNDLWWDVLILNGQITGYSSYFLTGAVAGTMDEMKIDKLYMHPRAHRQGYGGALINHVAAFARKRGCTRLTLAVNRHNQPAIDAYHKHGFHIADTSVREIGGGFLMDDYIMTKSVNE